MYDVFFFKLNVIFPARLDKLGRQEVNNSDLQSGGHELPSLNGTSRETFFFKTLHHGVEGEVRIEGDKIVVENFSYDGTAPDAFFYVGTSGCPSGSGTLLGELLGKHSKQRIELELPNNIRAGHLTLVCIASTSVLCRRCDLGFRMVQGVQR